jgi:hypothetical protein
MKSIRLRMARKVPVNGKLSRRSPRRPYEQMLVIGTLLLATVGGPGVAYGVPVTLSDLNSVVEVDPAMQSGMFRWKVDGIEQLHQQWFWYRVGNTAEASIDTLPLHPLTPILTDADGRPGFDTLTLLYTGAGFTIEVKYSLVGGPDGSNTSDITEQIRIINTGPSSLDFHFFQYTDFDLSNTPDDDTVIHVNANTVAQADSFVTVSETVVTPPPSHFELAFVFATRDKLNDPVATTLSDLPAGLPASLGPGNVTWAFQWDATIAPPGFPGNSFLISKDKNLFFAKDGRQIVPEPSTLILLGVGLLGAAGLGRRVRLLGRRRSV